MHLLVSSQRGSEETTKEADRSGLVGGSLNKQGTHEVCLGDCKPSPQPPSDPRKFTHRPERGSASYSVQMVSATLCSPKAVLETGSSYGNSGRVPSEDRGMARSLPLPLPSFSS